MGGAVDDRLPLSGAYLLAEVSAHAAVAPAQQHLTQDDGLPGLAGAGGDAATVQVVADLPEALTGQQAIDAFPHDCCFFRVDGQRSVRTKVPSVGPFADVG